MCKDNVVIQISSGLETRPIAKLVQVASQYRSTISLESGTRRVNAKSIMGMMTLGLDNGESVTITAEGPDEREALESIKDYLTQDQSA
ncbi:MAG: HPr family phosphocarrier protein [Eubacterium sp.]|nr:HPr family phosphocarrier protein [Eubacterium sp.]